MQQERRLWICSRGLTFRNQRPTETLSSRLRLAPGGRSARLLATARTTCFQTLNVRTHAEAFLTLPPVLYMLRRVRIGPLPTLAVQKYQIVKKWRQGCWWHHLGAGAVQQRAAGQEAVVAVVRDQVARVAHSPLHNATLQGALLSVRGARWTRQARAVYIDAHLSHARTAYRCLPGAILPYVRHMTQSNRC